MTNIKQIASNLLNSKHNNGFGIKCEAITEAMKKNDVSFKELFAEIIKQGNQEE